MALFTVAELSTLLGRTVDATTGALALDLATGLVEGELGSPVEATTSAVVLPVDPLTLTVPLPGLVVTEVTSVEVDGVVLTSDQWVWPAPQPYLQLLGVAPDWDDLTATVVYDHGLTTVPSMVKAVALSAAAV